MWGEMENGESLKILIIVRKLKVTVLPVHSVKHIERGSGDITPIILNLGTRWR
jgi:hypothetical protein